VQKAATSKTETQAIATPLSQNTQKHTPTEMVNQKHNNAKRTTHAVSAVKDEKVPLAHPTGSTDLVAQYEPTGQSVHAVDPARAYWPIEHAVATLKPAAPHWLPAGHMTQVEEPALGAYVPEAQGCVRQKKNHVLRGNQEKER
jgi:hypothetical protein